MRGPAGAGRGAGLAPRRHQRGCRRSGLASPVPSTCRAARWLVDTPRRNGILSLSSPGRSAFGFGEHFPSGETRSGHQMPGYHERCPRQPPWTKCWVSRAPRRDRGRPACQLAGQTSPRVLPAPRQDRRAEGVGQTAPRWAPLSGSARHARLALHAGTPTPRRPRRSDARCSMRVTHRHRARQGAGRSRRPDQRGPVSRAGGYLPSATAPPDVSPSPNGDCSPSFLGEKVPGTRDSQRPADHRPGRPRGDTLLRQHAAASTAQPGAERLRSQGARGHADAHQAEDGGPRRAGGRRHGQRHPGGAAGTESSNPYTPPSPGARGSGSTSCRRSSRLTAAPAPYRAPSARARPSP